MLKKQLSKEEAISLAKEWKLTSYIDVNNLIESLHIEQSRETKVCLITTNKEVVESILSESFHISTSLNIDCVTKISIRYGEENYTAITEYGEMFIDKESFTAIFKKFRNKIECSMFTRDELLKNIILNIIYVPEYNAIDSDNWRYTLLESDKLIIVLSATHILYTSEKDFINSLVLPYYSMPRLLFAIGNAQHIKSSEWKDAIIRIKMQLGDEIEAFPIFTESISEERKQRYSGYERTLSTILHETQKCALELRMTHHNDLDIYKESLLKQLLLQLKERMENALSLGKSGVTMAQENEEMITKSRKHIEDNVNLFLETPLLAKMRNSVDSFAKLFKDSLKEDITASKDIKQDARSLTRYLSAIWTQFSEDQNHILANEFEHEASMLIDMMKLDLKHITRNIHNVDIQKSIKEKLETAFSVNTFFSRKTSSGNGLTDALTIGGIISGILVTPLGWMAVFASEVIKVVNKESINNEYKEELKVKIEEIIDKNKNDLLYQAEKRFSQVSKDFHDEIIKYYDELLTSVREIVKEEEERTSKATETLEIINTII